MRFYVSCFCSAVVLLLCEVSAAVQPHVHIYFSSTRRQTWDLCMALRLLADFPRYFSTKRINEQTVCLQTVNELLIDTKIYSQATYTRWPVSVNTDCDWCSLWTYVARDWLIRLDLWSRSNEPCTVYNKAGGCHYWSSKPNGTKNCFSATITIYNKEKISSNTPNQNHQQLM